MIELAQLFQDVEAAVIQHEPAVEEIEQKAEATHENVGKATEHIDGAIKKARSRRRKQWWCLGIISTFTPDSFVLAPGCDRVNFMMMMLILLFFSTPHRHCSHHRSRGDANQQKVNSTTLAGVFEDLHQFVLLYGSGCRDSGGGDIVSKESFF